MQTWLSYHIYPHEAQDVFLARAVRPFLEKHIWSTPGARAFFVRFDDEKGPHIRLRLRGEADWLQDVLQPAFVEWFAERGEWEEAPYQPETERFGGAQSLTWAEEYFHISSRVVLDRLNRPYTYGDALYDAMRLHTMTVYAAEWSREKSAWYFGQLCEQWMELFFRPAEPDQAPADNWRETLREQFSRNFDPQRESLQQAMTDLWQALSELRFDPGQPEWVRWFRGNQLILKEFGANLDKVLPSLIHLTNNRLGVNNPDEVYVNFLLAQTTPGA